MDIETPDAEFKDVSFNDSSFKKLLDHLVREKDTHKHHLCLFLGLYEPNKKLALNQLASKLGRKITTIDTEKIVSKIESETFENLDDIFDDLHHSKDIIYFKNGDKLCGTYTGYSHSRVKYATPQERYFMNKVKDFEGLVVVDISEFTDADKTLRRAAQSIVTFTLPNSIFKRFFWHLKHYSFNGYDLKTNRPEAYGETG
ncbi:MAG TPA: hypothetical protein VJ964_04100 [Balneolaceae bacterium]|nr:hypothetical protein [Balneolaceae bacterium]